MTTAQERTIEKIKEEIPYFDLFIGSRGGTTAYKPNKKTKKSVRVKGFFRCMDEAYKF